MSSILSIESSKKTSIKQSAKAILGQALALVFRNRSNELFAHPESAPSSFRDKAIMAHLKNRAIEQNQQDFFERLHKDFWRGEGGAVFSDNCDHRFEDLFLSKQQPDFAVLRCLWEEKRPIHIAEFGCSSGLLLNHLTTNLTGVVSATGIEINQSQVDINQQNANRFDPRIQFVCSDGGEWLFNNAKQHSLFVSNGGVLEYFHQERLNQMLAYISQNLRPALFFAVEPVAVDHDWENNTESIPFGNELSFSHNYKHLFESNGFRVVHQRSVIFESWNMMATIAIADGRKV